MSATEHTTSQYVKKALPESFWKPILHQQQRKIYDRFARAFPPNAKWKILDLGTDASSDNRVNYILESNYPYESNITGSGLENGEHFKSCFPTARYFQLTRSAQSLPFADGEFDIVFCSAVIEHVGSHDQQLGFLREILRVSKRAFITTPNRWYPVEFHTMTPFLHWLPTRFYRRIYRILGFLFFSDEQNLNLLTRKSLLSLVPDEIRRYSRIESYRFLGLTSNYLLIVDSSY